jgi:hypothetical protein
MSGNTVGEGEVDAGSSFCQAPSEGYLDLLDEFAGDPRSVAGAAALVALRRGKRGGAVDERNADGPPLPTIGEAVAAVISFVGKKLTK